MTPTEKIDAAIKDVLMAGNIFTVEFLHRYEREEIRDAMRATMKKIMDDSYIEGGNDTHKAMKRAYHTTGNHPRLGMDNDENQN